LTARKSVFKVTKPTTRRVEKVVLVGSLAFLGGVEVGRRGKGDAI
jgi:hypothetical protein